MTTSDPSHVSHLTSHISTRIEDCRRLYEKYNGKHHELIEREMRALGHHDFHRRILYTRRERGRRRSGWIERFFTASPAAPPPYLRSSSAAPSDLEKNSGGYASNCAGPHYRVPAAASASRVPGSKSGTLNTARKDFPDFPDSPDFPDWLKAVSPSMNWDWPYQRYIQQKLQEVTDGTCKRLMIFLPPRHGKSELVTVRYAAWRLRQNPAMNVILASYNQQLANRFSRKIKTVLCDDFSRSAGCQPALAAPAATPRNADTPVRTGRTAATPRHSSLDTHYSTESPFPFTRPRPKNTEAEWETTHGGGLRAVGVGAGITGFGANLIIVDDPVKSRAEAESAAYRERLFDWFSDDLYTRLEPGGAMIVIQTRWHEDDLSGRLLSQMSDLTGEPWDVISLPAIAEHKGGGLSVSEGVTLNASPEESSVITSPLSPNDYSGEASSNSHFSHLTSHIPTDVLGRAPGEPLCPDRFNIAELNRIRQKMGTYSFSALFQQTPVPAEGGIFKKEWFKIVDSAPKNLRWMRGYDLAMKKGESNDFTASFRVGFDRKTGIYYIDGGFRKRIEYPDQRRYILGRIMAEPDTTHGIEATANGNAVIQDLRRDIQTQGRAFRAVDVKGDKTTRALVWSALLESGHAFLVRGPWNDDLIAECCSFPSAAHDDQIDAVSLAFQMHRRGRFAGHGF